MATRRKIFAVANDWRYLLHVAGVISRDRSKDQATAYITEIASDPFGLSIAGLMPLGECNAIADYLAALTGAPKPER